MYVGACSVNHPEGCRLFLKSVGKLRVTEDSGNSSYSTLIRGAYMMDPLTNNAGVAWITFFSSLFTLAFSNF